MYRFNTRTRANLIGRVFAIREQGGITRLTVTAKSPYKKNENGYAEDEFFNMALFGSSAEFAKKHLKKDMIVEIDGHLETYTPQGEKYSQLQISVDRISVIHWGNDQAQGQTQGQAQGQGFNQQQAGNPQGFNQQPQYQPQQQQQPQQQPQQQQGGWGGPEITEDDLGDGWL